jgi:hypothetical protein
MLIITVVSEVVFIIALLLGPETKGKELTSDLTVGDAPSARAELPQTAGN